MSKIARPTRSNIPKGATGAARPSTSIARPTTGPTKSSLSKAEAPSEKSKKPAEQKPAFEIPAFSIAPRKPKVKIDWDAVKHDMARRQAPEGEDVKSIKRLLAEIGTNKIPVHEFINMISPYTSDNGAVLRTVMAQDVDSFRKLARKVYETMTKDVSDVLVNEQLHLMAFYEERHDIFTDKMMNAINEIYEMAPTFDFQRYLKDKQDYLNMILPLPVDVNKDETEKEMQRRQQAYHRLLWLRSEGERMAEENRRLQKRLQELKSQQDREQAVAAEMAAHAETTRRELLEEEANVREKLDALGKAAEKTIVQNEALVNLQLTEEVMSKPKTTRPKKKGPVRKKKIKRPEWVSDVAADIEEQAIQEVIAAEAESVPPAVTIRKPGEAPRQASPPRSLLSPRARSPPMHQAEPLQHQSPAQMGQRQQPQQVPGQMPPPQRRQQSPQMPPVQQMASPQQLMQQRQMSPAIPPVQQMRPPQQPMQQRQMSPPMPPQPQQMPPSPQMRAMSPQQQMQQFQQSPQSYPGQSEQQMYQAPQHPRQQYQAPQQVQQPRQETRIEQSSTTTQVLRGRRVQGPRDSWGGFY